MTESEGHVLVAQSCLAYILHLDSSGTPPDAADSFPLFDYAVHYWYYHVHQSGIYDKNLARLIEEVLETSWEIYRLVTYPNISTRYNPWLSTHASTSEPGNDIGQDIALCSVCRGISYEGLKKHHGLRHRTYATIVTSARECKLCEMIRCALLQFGIARHCQMSSETTLSLEASERIARGIDVEMHRIVGNSEIILRLETQDPFLMISCFCYFGRLHLYTNPGTWLQSEGRDRFLISQLTIGVQESPMASEILGRPVQSNPQSILAECRRWFQHCRENHPKCQGHVSSSPPPLRLIEIGEEGIRLIDNSERAADKFATLTWQWGDEDITSLSLRELVPGTFLDNLPSSFQDVIRVTQLLGIRHLWIDILCVRPNDIIRKKGEVHMVPDYYTNAVLNIVAGVQGSNTGILSRRLPPRFQGTRIDGAEDVFIGWLGTDAYNDPRGLRWSKYPDAWKYKSPPHLRGWAMQDMELARRNLVIQGDGESAPDSAAMCTMLTSQLYLQCQEEIRWENGQRRPGIADSSADWYDLVEEYSDRNVTRVADRLRAVSHLAHRYSCTSQHHCGEYLAGLWSNDLPRGLLWRAEGDRNYRPTDRCYAQVPSWSWAALPRGRVKHVWPSDATPLASTQFTSIGKTRSSSHDFGVVVGYLTVRSLFVEFRPVTRAWSAWNGDIYVEVLDENDHKETLTIRYMLDNFNPETTSEAQFYGIRITRRIGLLLIDAGNGQMERVGLFIVAKPDTLKWTAITGEREVQII